jgi:Ulp1 family protease
MDQTHWDAQKLFQIINNSGLEYLTDKDYLIIPANISENHWVIIALNNKKKTIEYYDSLGTRNMDKICGIIERLLEALGMENYDWEGMEVPRQQNSYESWIFALKIVQALAGNLNFSFNSENIKYYRKIILAELRDGKIYVE